MGLDIVAFKGLTKTDAEENIHVSHDGFGYNNDLETGWYDSEDSFHFRAGSYSSYNGWRRALCEAFNGMTDIEFWKDSDSLTDAPFYELINFSDCEGQIGPKVSEKLYQEFENPENEKKFEEYCEKKFGNEPGIVKEFYMANWQDFKKAFEAARHNGLVQWC
jgi:hypothetical protein